jgi:hypothetical protein
MPVTRIANLLCRGLKVTTGAVRGSMKWKGSNVGGEAPTWFYGASEAAWKQYGHYCDSHK